MLSLILAFIITVLVSGWIFKSEYKKDTGYDRRWLYVLCTIICFTLMPIATIFFHVMPLRAILYLLASAVLFGAVYLVFYRFGEGKFPWS